MDGDSTVTRRGRAVITFTRNVCTLVQDFVTELRECYVLPYQTAITLPLRAVSAC
jgi:hypothetical protein